MANWIKNNPTLVVAAVLSILTLLGSFGLLLNDQQTSAISGLIFAILALIGGATTHTLVSPYVNVAALKKDDGTLAAGPAAAQDTGTEVVVVAPPAPTVVLPPLSS